MNSRVLYMAALGVGILSFTFDSKGANSKSILCRLKIKPAQTRVLKHREVELNFNVDFISLFRTESDRNAFSWLMFKKAHLPDFQLPPLVEELPVRFVKGDKMEFNWPFILAGYSHETLGPQIIDSIVWRAHYLAVAEGPEIWGTDYNPTETKKFYTLGLKKRKAIKPSLMYEFEKGGQKYIFRPVDKKDLLSIRSARNMILGSLISRMMGLNVVGRSWRGTVNFSRMGLITESPQSSVESSWNNDSWGIADFEGFVFLMGETKSNITIADGTWISCFSHSFFLGLPKKSQYQKLLLPKQYSPRFVDGIKRLLEDKKDNPIGPILRGFLTPEEVAWFKFRAQLLNADIEANPNKILSSNKGTDQP